MWHRSTAVGVALSLCLAWPVPARAREEPLVEKVRKAIKSGVGFLRDKQEAEGHWEVDTASVGKRGGWTSLAMLALLNSGIKPEDAMIQRGLKWLRGVEPEDTYVVGLQTMVFAAAGEKRDLLRIQRNVDWLIGAAVRDGGGNIKGWSYKKARAGQGAPDNSNTQYALLGLHEGHVAGAVIKRQVWKEILKFYTDSQNGDGSWGYSESMNEPRLTMTTAGLCGLIIAGMELNKGREEDNGDGTFKRCGEYDENPPVRKALDWIGTHLRIELNDQLRPIYYNLYGIERAGRLSGQRFLGRHDWYREGCEYLVNAERIREDGSWAAEGQLEGWPVISTSFALLFLSKGRTPVLISKMMHGPAQDWNNDRNDARHLVEFASKELFKRQPLAWQVFDARHALGENQDDLLNATSELLQSPIVYFNGHAAPQFGTGEEDLLKKYVNEGGFILGEACCGKEEFGKGFRRLMRNLFDEDLLQPLPADHPIWTAYYLLSPKDFPKDFKLYGIQQGCKTVVVFSPKDLSCYWESNRLNDPDSLKRFQLGANIIAYATGMELPKPRLTEVEVTADVGPQKVIRRGFLEVAQVRHDGDWAPAPRAMHNLMLYLHDKPRLDVVIPNPADLDREGIRPSN
ncbi:MAG TPA: DUF4159 domain-containing protein, partial [Gemmataceae bacterium]|nr:DUF4159 domain-containing protein [Gemmataceae bacterium]